MKFRLKGNYSGIDVSGVAFFADEAGGTIDVPENLVDAARAMSTLEEVPGGVVEPDNTDHA